MKELKRTTSHILKFSNSNKLCYIDNLFKDYRIALKECVALLVDGKLPLKALITSTVLDFSTIKHAAWKQLVYKNASEIVRSCLKKNHEIRYKRYKRVYSYFKKKGRMKKFTDLKFSELKLKQRFYVKPEIDQVSITIDQRLCDLETGNTFDWFLRIKLPYFYKRRSKDFAVQIKLPIKEHKVSRKYKDWERAKSIQLISKNGNYYANFFYSKEEPVIKPVGLSIGIDVGYKKLISTSNGEFFGAELEGIYEKIAKSERGSKRYKKLITYKNNKINEAINKIDLKNIKTVFVEDLKGIKEKTFSKANKKLSKSFKNKSQYAQYTKVYEILDRKCKEQGVQIVKVLPMYTSQTCSRCKIVDKSNRHGEKYTCKSCGLEIDADYNAAINILNRGFYGTPDIENGKDLSEPSLNSNNETTFGDLT